MTQYSQKVEITRVQNRLVRRLVESEVTAYENWIRSAVARGEHSYAEKLSKELELYEQMFHVFIPDDVWDLDFRTQRMARSIT